MRQLISIFLLGLALSACQNKQAKKEQKSSDDGRTLHFRYDKRVETVYFVLMLTDNYNELICQHPTTYKFAARKHFSQYKDHKAVQLAKRLINEGFSFDYAANWIFQFSDFPAFEKVREVDYPFFETTKNGGRHISPDTLELFRKELVDFYQVTNCDSFPASQKEFLDNMITETEKGFARKNLPAVIEDYYGVKENADFSVILSPLLHSGGFEATAMDKANNKIEIIAAIGPNGEKEFIPTFDRQFIEQDLVIHEFGHHYEGNITNEFMPKTEPYKASLFPPVQEEVEQQGYSDWESFMHELVDRAVTIRIVENTFGKAPADSLMNYEKSAGFKYVQDITDELKTYESQRDKYPMMKDFFPLLVDRLGKKKR